MRLRSLALLLILAAVPCFGLPANLVVGGGFDTPEDLRKWRSTSNKAFLDWQGLDGQARPASGSASVFGSVGGLSQCVAVTPGREYDFGARVLVTRGVRKFSPSGPRAYVQVAFWGHELCQWGSPFGEARTPAVVGATGRFTAVSARVFVPDEARGVLLTMVGVDEEAPPVAAAPVLFDDVFLQQRGGCVPDETTLCLAGGKLGATVTVFDAHDAPHQAAVVQLSTTSGYFYTYSPDDAELTIKTELSEGGGKGFVIGGMTDLRLEITVKDWDTLQEKRYTNGAQHRLVPIVDGFTAE